MYRVSKCSIFCHESHIVSGVGCNVEFLRKAINYALFGIWGNVQLVERSRGRLFGIYFGAPIANELNSPRKTINRLNVLKK